jgi:hypothetical protein
MKMRILVSNAILLTAISAAFHPNISRAGTFVTDFNSGLPANTAIYGNAAIAATGGYTNSGYAQLTIAAGSQNGALVITNDLDAGIPVVSFTASFKLLVGGGDRWTYADGLSFNFAPDVPLGTTSLPESGAGSGLTVGFRTYPTSGNPDPTITALGAHTSIEGSPVYVDNVRANTFVDVVIQLNPDNTLAVVYDGAYVYSNVPALYMPGAGSLFWIGARTGGAFENHFIDNLNIATRTNPAPFIKTFAPRGRQASSTSPINIVLSDFSSQVATNTIVVTLDGNTVTPTLTQDGSGNTTIHFVPSAAFAATSKHSVSVSFADNASTPNQEAFSWQFTVAEPIPSEFVTVFSDGFESYNLGTLDKEPLYWNGGANGPNAAPNGSGNPWFGPHGPNGQVVYAENGVNPHGGTKMVRGNVAGDQDAIWCDLAYRVHGGQPIKGNCQLDWWAYDPNTSSSTTAFKDYISLYYYNNENFPATADWPAGWDNQGLFFWENGIDYTLEQSVTVGGSGYNQAGGNYDPAKYQIRLEENKGATYGLDGWCNTAVSRSTGWHHNRIVLGPPHADGSVMVYFFIDDMSTPAYSGLSTLATTGFGLIEIVTAWGDTDIAYYDDISFAFARPPNLTVTGGPGANVTLTWPGSGWTLQSAPSLTGPWTDLPSAASPYQYDATSASSQVFRLRF